MELGATYLSGLPARLQAALRASAQLVATRARAKAPRRTGYLASSIHAGGGFVQVDAPYGVEVELGTHRQHPQPYLRPALIESLAEIRAAFIKEMFHG